MKNARRRKRRPRPLFDNDKENQDQCLKIKPKQKQENRSFIWCPSTATPSTTGKSPLRKGDRIPYASRVYDHEEMVNLVDSALEFWLTSGRYTDEFEAKLAEYLGVRYCALVNSGSSANLIAFMALTSPPWASAG